MADLLVGAIVVVSLAMVMTALSLVAVRIRRRGSAGAALGAAMAAYDEAMHATAYDTFVQIREQDERNVVVPAPGEA